MTDLDGLGDQLDRIGAAVERARQLGRARPAYRERWLGGRHLDWEVYARQLLAEAHDGRWHRLAAGRYADDAATLDRCIRYILRQERPAESVRVEWLRHDGTWVGRFPRRPLDPARLTGRGLFDPAALAALHYDGRQFAGRLRLGPKRGTAPPPASPRGRPPGDLLGDALVGNG